MNRPNGFEDRLERLGKAAAPGPSIVEDVMRRVDATLGFAGGRPRLRRKWVMKSSLGLAACLVIGVTVWCALDAARPPTLYAQVMEAFEEVPTLHFVAKVRKNARWEKWTEVWYKRGEGVALTGSGLGRPMTILDNGTYRWVQVAGSDVAPRYKSGPDLRDSVFRLLTSPQLLERDRLRRPEGDAVINGVECQLFVHRFEREHVTVERRFWIDRAKRVRRRETGKMKEGRWEPTFFLTAEYDIPVRRSRFEPHFGQDVRIIDAQAVLDDRFGLHRAIFTREVAGMMVAVHELMRTEDGTVYVVASVRPTPTALRGFRPLLGSWFARMRLVSHRRVRRDYRHVQVAMLRHGGMQVGWWLFTPIGPWTDEGKEPQRADEFLFSGHLDKRGDLDKEYQPRVPNTWQSTEFEFSLPLPGVLPRSLDQLVKTAYGDVKDLEPLLAYPSRAVVSESVSPVDDAGQLFRFRRPSEISQEDFLAAVKRAVAWPKESRMPKG